MQGTSGSPAPTVQAASPNRGNNAQALQCRAQALSWTENVQSQTSRIALGTSSKPIQHLAVSLAGGEAEASSIMNSKNHATMSFTCHGCQTWHLALRFALAGDAGGQPPGPVHSYSYTTSASICTPSAQAPDRIVQKLVLWIPQLQ